jgi:hypothetical protein
MAKVIEEHEELKKELEELFSNQNVTLIDGCDGGLVLEEGRRRLQQNYGIEYALEYMNKNPDERVIVYSPYQPQQLFAVNKYFRKLMNNTNAYFANGAFYEDIEKILAQPRYKNAALDVVSTTEHMDLMAGQLQHDYRYRPKEVISQAETQFGFKGTDEEILNKLREYRHRSIIERGTLRGLFVDVEGTLWKDDTINSDVVKSMIEYSKTGPVSIWTGSDVRQLASKIGWAFEKECRNQGSVLHTITPIFSKHDFQGFQPTTVIDDLPKEEFEKEYSMKPVEYIQIT